MEIICTRPDCANPHNFFSDLDSESELRTVKQRYCRACGMELLLGDRYLPIKLLGQGGFGVTFLARDRHQPNFPLCVVKQFKPDRHLEASEKEIARQLFEREANVLGQLGQKHPQIPVLYAFFASAVSERQQTDVEQYFYLVQEFIDGQDLERELELKGSFSEAEVVEVLLAMLEILDFVHEQQVIHRDLKPANIMRDRQGKLYLLDFGAVKQITALGRSQAKTTAIYSPGFAPPEQVSGLQIYPATDLYALAVTGINLLTGKSVEELYNSGTNSWQWHQFTPYISDRLKQILDRLLLPAVEERFQSARTVLELLTDSSTENIKNTSIDLAKAKSVRSPRRKKRKKRPFSRSEIIFGAGFTGFESALLYIGLTSWLSLSAESLSIVSLAICIIIFVLYRRAITKVDLTIVATVSAIVIAFVPKFQGSLNAPTIMVVATSSAIVAIAVTLIWRFVYKLRSRSK